MSESAGPSPEPQPFADLLALLKARGLSIGVREHLVVARLISRWDHPGTGSLRNALAAVLARNQDEVKLVHEAFDELYTPDAADYESFEMARERCLARRPEKEETLPEPVPRERPPGLWGRVRRAARVQWMAWLAAAALLVSFAYLTRSLSPSAQKTEPPPPQELPSREDAPPLPSNPPQPPVIDKTRWLPDRELSLTVAAAAALLLFNWLYMIRAGRQAGRRGRRRWGDELDAMPDPQEYDLALSGLLKPPFSSALLDEVAKALSRSSTSSTHELDVDRTLERTFRAGLAPQLVWRSSRLAHPLVVLEEVGDEMEPFGPRVTALLEGLKARGVPLDRWQLDTETGRLSRASGKPGPALDQLARSHADSPLLVLGTGKGLRRQAGRTPWLMVLRRWKRRAWLHPAVDLRYWRPELRALQDLEIDVWPMSPQGLLAVAKLLARGFGPEPPERTPAEHRVVPLDVDRLRWLLSLAPRRDPELAELLRQQFCPQVPSAALIEALEAPPLDSPPGIGPSAPEVHAFLWEVLETSRPPERSAGHERWRLDRALQALYIPGLEKLAVSELRDLAQGPMALEVEHVLEPLAAAGGVPEPIRQPLQGVLREAGRRAIRKGLFARKSELRTLLRRSLPTVGEVAAAVAVLGVLFLALPRLSKAFQTEEQVAVRWTYLLKVEDQAGTGPFTLRLELCEGFRREDVPEWIEIFRGGDPLGRPVRLDAQGRAQWALTDDERGAWFHAEAEMGEGLLAVSNKELVGRQGFTGWLMILPRDEEGRSLRATLILENGQERQMGIGETLFQLTTGDWVLRASAPGYEMVAQNVSVAAGTGSNPTEIEIRFRRTSPPPPPKITVSTPTPATVPAPAPAQPQQPQGGGEPAPGGEELIEENPDPPGEVVTEPPPKPAPSEAQPPAQLSTPEIQEAVLSVLGRFENSDLHVEKIPAELLAKASKQISMPADEKILALLDARSLAGKIHPMIFGVKGIYYLVHKSGSGQSDRDDPTVYISYEDLMMMEFRVEMADFRANWSAVTLGRNVEPFSVAGSKMKPGELRNLLNTLADELTRRTSEKRARPPAPE